ncbi:MAG: tRNA (adenosine(37)-N6)-dimethylallyltransferase MiaA [Paracoccaceae bacterium]|nr:tRNA (adenosine(37)-N6)-dimethylallyltransferase MiaA [Paracoccaceae bacterium]
MRRAICITGCTASGKSKIATQLASIRPSVIINADSIQVYECMRILSSRPTEEDFGELENRLYGHIKCGSEYSVGKWLEDARAAIDYAYRKKKIPIIVGGTGLYFSALINGLALIPSISKETREKSDNLRKNCPDIFLHDLKIKDSMTYDNIDKRNFTRVQRAWEVLTDTGYGISYWQQTKGIPLLNKHEFQSFIISCDQLILRDNILKRSHKMFEQGIDNEVKCILNSNFNSNPLHPAHKAIGFAEVGKYIAGTLAREQAIDMINVKTRQYAKKQRTWFRNQLPSWQVLEITKNCNLMKVVEHIDKNALS